MTIISESYGSSHQRFPVRKNILRNCAKFTGRHLCQSLRVACLRRLLLKLAVFMLRLHVRST